MGNSFTSVRITRMNNKYSLYNRAVDIIRDPIAEKLADSGRFYRLSFRLSFSVTTFKTTDEFPVLGNHGIFTATFVTPNQHIHPP